MVILNVRKRLLLYLDTNIFLDLIRKRNDDSVELFRKIKKGGYRTVTSFFTLLEITGDEQKRVFAEREIVMRKKSFDEVRTRISERDLGKAELESIELHLRKEVYKPFVDTEKIEIRYLDDEGWDRALELLGKLNISASDSIHLAIADIRTCDIFVTNDSQLRKVASKFFEPSKMIFASSSEIGDKIKILREIRSGKKKGEKKRS
ncbi:MAG: type II toxin-antitoxin system VapC family toxin [Candidatus Bathyarchaeota archaeon]|nr:type II toxin-antitoxin system VapC family toxin [Candidatus Bathyarchaeota archaeon]